MNLEEQLRTKQLVVFLGTGGVGKTTIAAASALHASRTRKTLVLTIDPARRLADALGVKMGSETVRVKDNLDALMLDSKAALDALVRRYATTPDTLERILHSRFYEQLSDAFAGSEEFVAMGTLHDLVADGNYDVIVVDTPPSRHAIEFLRVNEKLIRVYESGVVRYLFKPTRFLRLGGGYMANALAKWTSSEYVEEFAEFMVTFDQMFQDMERRVRAIDAVITEPGRTSLNIVVSAEEESVPQAARLYDAVTKDLHLPMQTCIVNRYHAPLAHGLPDEVADPEKLHKRLGVERADAKRFADDARVAAHFYDLISRDQAKYAAQLRDRIGVPLTTVPMLAGSVHDLASLEKVRDALFRS
jgi:anion-transporting  ArsA/GET3 family ATPase